MRRESETSPGVSPDPDSLERLQAAVRRRSHWPWILIGLAVGGGAGVVSLEPHVVRDLPRPSFLPASLRAALSVPSAAPTPAPAVIAAPVPTAPTPAAAASVHAAAGASEKPEPAAPAAAAPAPETSAAPEAQAVVALEDNHPGALEEDDTPHWDPSASSQWALGARSTAPGQTWQDAANIADWANVAQLIDALPPAEQADPGTRYARAVAARELGSCKVALTALDDLESSLPLLHDEIQSARALCQLEVGPYDAAYEYFTREQSTENLILAARAALNGGELGKAQLTVERAFDKLRRRGESRQGRRNEIAARSLRARIAEARNQPKVAAKDWLWLASEATTDKASRTADSAYERLSGERLTKVQRFQRLRDFSREGLIEQTLRERDLLATAPGMGMDPGDVLGALAWAYYHSRRDYLKAAELFHEAAEHSDDARVKYLFFAARALSRGNQDDRAIAEYEQLAKRYPTNGFAEQAYYRIARLEYGLGRWDRAERAYTEYLERYSKKGGGEYATTARYELAITRLGAKQRTDEAARTLEQLQSKEHNAQRRALLSHLEAVALETTQDPKKTAEAVERYRSIIADQPLSFAAMASAARLRGLGLPEAHRVRLPSTLDVNFEGGQELPPLPDKARFLAAIGLHTDAERALFDHREQARRHYTDREREELCQMLGSLDRGYRSYALADHWLKSEDLGRPPSSDNLWAWRCAYPRPYNNIVSSVEQRYQLPDSLVYAVMRQESGFRPNVVSPAGAVGLMQLMPATARRAADEITQQPGAPWVPDPHRPTNILNNVELGGFYLSKLLSLLGNQMPLAIAAYNAGPAPVSHWLEGTDALPVDVWVAHIPYDETRDYVASVLGNWLAYRYLSNPHDLPELSLGLTRNTKQELADAY